MQCPRCGVDLLASVREDVEIDCCPQCGGIWLDHGELMKMITAYVPQFVQDTGKSKTAPPSKKTEPDQS